jgi:hypothetical protein
VRVNNTLIAVAVLSLCAIAVSAQQTQNASEQRVALSETAVALDSQGQAALEGSLRTTTLHGAPDLPVTNVRVIIKNVGSMAYGYVSGLITFYDGASVRCGEGLFKADVVATGEAIETDTPGIRIRCSPATWRMVATNLLPRIAPGPMIIEAAGAPRNLIISVDGEEHPIQLEKPMILNVGDRQRTIILRRTP